MFVQTSRIILSFLFVFGAISKLISMPFFDGMVAELILGADYFNQPKGMLIVQWLTRILVALELWIGIVLLQNKGFKRITLPLTLITLLLFTIHLFYESLKKENGFIEGNCGCFGDVLPMNNLESIIKNGIGIILAIYVWLKYKGQSFQSWMSSLFVGLVTLFTLSFGVKSYQNSPEIQNSETSNTPLLDTTNQSITMFNNQENIDIDSTSDQILEEETPIAKSETKTTSKVMVTTTTSENNTSISIQEKPQSTLGLLNYYVPDLKNHLQKNDTTLVCLFSMTCSHCQEVYRDLSSMRSSKKLPPIYLVNYGSEYEQNYFFIQAGNKDDPHYRIDGFTIFKRLLEGKTYPRILCVSQGKIIKEWDVDSYQKENFMNHFGIRKIKKEEQKKGLQLDLNQGNSPW
jgi:hypothetical protein